MIPRRSLGLQAQVALVSSDRVLLRTLRALAQPGCETMDEAGPNLRDGAYQTLLMADIAGVRQRDIDAALNKAWRPRGAKTNVYSLSVLEDIAQEFLFFDGDRVSVRPEQLLDYGKLIADVEPAFLIGSLLAERLDRREITVASLDALLETQGTLALPRPEAGRPYADNHVHLGGVTSVGHALVGLAMGLGPRDGKWNMPKSFLGTFEPHLRDPVPTLIKAFSMLFAIILKQSHADTKQSDHVCRQELADGLRSLLDSGFSGDGPFPMSMLVMAEMPEPGPQNIACGIAIKLAQHVNQHRWSEACILLSALICMLDRNYSHTSEWLRLVLIGFVHLSHALRNTMIMHGLGLDSFVEFFRAPSRMLKAETFTRARMRWLVGSPDQRAEIKTGWINPTGLRSYAKEAKAIAIDQNDGDQPWQSNHPWQRYHLSFHFVRSRSKEKSEAGLLRLEKRRRDIHKEARKIRRQMEITDVGDLSAIIDGRLVHQELTSRIRSFDVAGNENDEPIEVFAPVLRWLREKPLIQMDRRGERLVGRRALSIHAGEDFDHIAGGLRHLDETIRFCNLGPADRVGHALALGVNPHDWAKRQDRAFVRLEPHFDNLVWLWHYATMLSGRLMEASNVLAGLERRINFYGRLLGVTSQDADIHFRAWRWRGNCPLMMRLGADDPELVDTRYWIPDHEALRTRKSPECYQQLMDYLYQRRKEASSEITVFLDKDGQPETDKDCFGTLDLDFVEALQDHLMTEYDRRGITIEACPSGRASFLL